MSALTKNQKIEALVKLVQKKSRGVGLSPPPERTVIETLMYAAVLENAPFGKANEAFAVLTNYYIDWNEVRVCTTRELADTISVLPKPDVAANRIRKSLQGIFEKTYVFDLEELRKKGKALAEHIHFLESISAGSPYMIQYAAQAALDGYVIPLDEASLRIMRRLGLAQVSPDGSQEVCTGLDRVILKKSSVPFSMQIHHFAAEYFDIPDSPELLALLSAIDPKAVERSWTAPILTAAPPKPVPPPPKPEPAAVPAVPEVCTPVKPEKNPVVEKAPTNEKAPVKPEVKPKDTPKPQEITPPAKGEPKKPEPKKSESPKGEPKKPAAVPVKKPDSAAERNAPEPVKKPKKESPSKSLRKKKPK